MEGGEDLDIYLDNHTTRNDGRDAMDDHDARMVIEMNYLLTAGSQHQYLPGYLLAWKMRGTVTFQSEQEPFTLLALALLRLRRDEEFLLPRLALDTFALSGLASGNQNPFAYALPRPFQPSFVVSYQV